MALSPDDTLLYYFFSTVAQTFAGGFGIIGAFAGFKLQTIAQALRDSAGIIVKRYKEGIKDKKPQLHEALDGVDDDVNAQRETARLVLAREYGRLVDHVAAHPPYVGEDDLFREEDAKEAAEVMRMGRAQWDRLVKDLKRSAAWAAASVGGSLIALSLAAHLALLPRWVQWAVIVGFLVIGAGTLHSFWRLIQAAVTGGTGNATE